MARALRDAAGRALSIGARGATTDCADCCEPVTIEYLKACPCQSEFGNGGCAAPEAPCVFIDTRSTIDGRTGVPLIDYANNEVVIIRIEGICYRLGGQVFYDDGLGGPLSVPVDAVKHGGPGITIEWRENCVDGCAEVNLGPEYFEAFPCSGCPTNDGFRFFVCISAAQGMEVIYGLSSTITLCIDRSIGYTLAQIEADAVAGGYGVSIDDDPQPLKVWTGGGSDARYLPASSCCYSAQRGDCNPTDCLQGQNWATFGGDDDRWFPLDTCCGTENGLLYSVAFGFSRVQVQEVSPGDTITTTITATVDSVVNDGSSIVVNLMVTTIGVRTGVGQTFRSDSPATITLERKCCLTNHAGLPQMVRFEPSGIPVPGDQGAFYSRRVLIDPDTTTARRNAWNISPWAGPFQLAFLDGDPATTYASTGTTLPTDSCRRFDFRHTETVNYGGGGSVNVYINLVVQTIPDQSFPCGYSGPCGPNGWGSDLDMELP